MQIRSLGGGYSDPSALAKKLEAEDKRATQTATPVGELAPPQAIEPIGPRETLFDILARYDVTEITPTDFSEMIQELRDEGVISDQEFQELSTIRVDLDNEGIGPDEEIDLMQYFTDRLEHLARGMGNKESQVSQVEQTNALRGRLDWVEKFGHIQSSPKSLGIDTTA